MSKGLFHDLLVIDFSTLLPGPLATLMLAECGARVVKVERPGGGDAMRGYDPRFGTDSVNFALLNRGKQSLTIDLKDAAARPALDDLLGAADILVEQFRPGVMDRLGLGFAAVRRLNPGIVYCSITGYGQTGPNAAKAGHDLNYMAETGCLGLSGDDTGAPVLPPVLAADIAGGAYPAMINILMGLMRRMTTGEGCHIDVAMTDNLFTLPYWGLGEGFAAEDWPRAGSALVTGRSPRYGLYRTGDSRHLAVAALEDRFWAAFCDAIGLADKLRDDARDPAATRHRIAEIIAGRTAAAWRERLAGRDSCCSVVATLDEAVAGTQARARRLFDRQVAAQERRIPALPVPISALFRDDEAVKGYPALDD